MSGTSSAVRCQAGVAEQPVAWALCQVLSSESRGGSGQSVSFYARPRVCTQQSASGKRMPLSQEVQVCIFPSDANSPSLCVEAIEVNHPIIRDKSALSRLAVSKYRFQRGSYTFKFSTSSGISSVQEKEQCILL